MTGYFTRTYEHWREEFVDDGMGGATSEWVKQGDVKGRAYPATMTDTFSADRLAGKVTWTFAGSPDLEIAKGEQIRFGGRILRIRAVSVTGSGRRLEATCEEEQ